MSYCRFSDDNFRCDVYAYEDCCGGYTIHVASTRFAGECPHLPLLSEVSPEEWYAAYQRQMRWCKTAERVAIGGPSDGATIHSGSPGECAEELERLRGEGYHVPQGAIDTLLAEEAEEEGGG